MALHNPLRRFARDESGNAAVEYAILLGLILAVTFLGLDVLSRTTESALQKVGDALQASATPGAANQATPTLDENAKLQVQVAETNLWLTLAIAGGVASCMFAALIIVWRQTRKKLREAAAQADQVAQVQQEVKYVQPKLIAKRQSILKTLATNIDRLLHSTLQVEQLMTTTVATVHPELPIDDVKQVMEKQEVRHLMVVSHVGKLLGVISDRDVKGKPGTNAGQIMTRDLVSVGPHVEISPAVTMMLDHGISSLPVVENGELKGIVTSTDLMMAVQCCMHVLRNATEAMEQAAPQRTGVSMRAALTEDSPTTAPTQA